MSAPFTHELRVRYGECDPQGIVFNANYLLYFDVAFTELWRVAVGRWAEMNAHDLDAVVANATLDFRAPARNDDVLTVALAVEQLGTSSITTSMRIARGEELLVEGTLRHVIVDTETWRPAQMPDWIRTGLQRYEVRAR